MNATYGKMWNAFQNGFITETEWRDFCGHVLNVILVQNRDVLYRLKNNIQK